MALHIKASQDLLFIKVDVYSHLHCEPVCCLLRCWRRDVFVLFIPLLAHRFDRAWRNVLLTYFRLLENTHTRHVTYFHRWLQSESKVRITDNNNSMLVSIQCHFIHATSLISIRNVLEYLLLHLIALGKYAR